MSDNLDRIQYTTSQLAQLLGVDEIIDMRVAEVGGRKVLQVVSRSQDEETFRPARIEDAGKYLPAPKKRRPASREPDDRPRGPKKGLLTGALDAVFGEDRKRDPPPPWMR